MKTQKAGGVALGPVLSQASRWYSTTRVRPSKTKRLSREMATRTSVGVESSTKPCWPSKWGLRRTSMTGFWMTEETRSETREGVIVGERLPMYSLGSFQGACCCSVRDWVEAKEGGKLGEGWLGGQ